MLHHAKINRVAGGKTCDTVSPEERAGLSQFSLNRHDLAGADINIRVHRFRRFAADYPLNTLAFKRSYFLSSAKWLKLLDFKKCLGSKPPLFG